MEDKLLLPHYRVRELARLLNVAEVTLRRRIKRGELAVQHLGRLVLIPQAEVARLLAQHGQRG
jgi:excisionase family DNA binding protein